MAGYAASSRIASVAPRARRERLDRPWTSPSDAPSTALTVDLAGASTTRIEPEWMAALRERWAQATFYLFDANSWR